MSLSEQELVDVLFFIEGQVVLMFLSIEHLSGADAPHLFDWVSEAFIILECLINLPTLMD